jgi:hypothetical protein
MALAEHDEAALAPAPELESMVAGKCANRNSTDRARLQVE